MPRFSVKSLAQLETCHPDLRALFTEVIRSFDCSVLCGHRGKADQNALFDQGMTQVRFPNSKHNITPSRAVDVVPYPIDWRDIERFHLFAGFVLGIAHKMYERGDIDHRIRWGGDWDSDTKTKDEKFRDLPHFELAQSRPADEVIG